MKKTELGELLRAVANFVDENPGSAIHSLLKGAQYSASVSHPGEKTHKSAGKLRRPKIDVDQVVGSLASLESREEGHERLSQLTRIDLEAICRSQDLPIQKGDSVGLLKSRIVEHLIGSRLRSRAIRDSKVGSTNER
jgi:hypothetical protein